MQTTVRQAEIAPPALRILAFVIDSLLLLPLNLAIGYLVLSGFDPISLFRELQNSQRFDFFIIGSVTQAVYAIGFVSALQATPGKLALGMRIVRADGQPLLPDTAILRYLVVFVGNLLLEIEFIISVFLMFSDPARRTIHDRVARTLVVRIRRETGSPESVP